MAEGLPACLSFLSRDWFKRLTSTSCACLPALICPCACTLSTCFISSSCNNGNCVCCPFLHHKPCSLISLDDKTLYYSNWLRGDVVALDISDPDAPTVKGRIWLGGSIAAGTGVRATDPAQLAAIGLGAQPEVPVVKGVKLRGGPQMLQLSLDGKRLYVTNSLLSPWDAQFYPDLLTRGSYLVRVDVAEDGSLSLNPDFIVDFEKEPGGAVLAHEVRYPGGGESLAF
jgi:hypothetical protein